jgi:hypothetical protein
VIPATALLLSIAMTANTRFIERYYIVNGPEYTAVSRKAFDRDVRDGMCLRVWVATYAEQHVIVHGCDV